MSYFAKKIKDYIEQHSLIEGGDKLVCAVSGGPDSMAMLDYLVENKQIYKIEIIVAHVDHMLRGEDSLADMNYVHSYCQQHGLLFETRSIPIKEKMADERLGVQEAARKYRYMFFEEVMEKYTATKLAVAQHADDQIETILMRLTRGSSGMSRAGILSKRRFAKGELIRPLLAVTKEEIQQYCQIKMLAPRMDVSNEHLTYTRNRFRHKILPFLKEENPRVHEHFQRFSEEISEDELYLTNLAKEEMEKLFTKLSKEEIIMEIPLFNSVPLPLQRRVIQLILNYLYYQKKVELTALHMDSIQKVIKGENPSAQLDFPNNLKIVRSYDKCAFTFHSHVQAQTYTYELNKGEECILPTGACIQFLTETVQCEEVGQHMYVHPNDVELPFVVRTRKPGDRIALKGMNGTKKVKDLFIDLKIPLQDRATWPIITDQSGEVIWIPGLKKSKYELKKSKETVYYKLHYKPKI